MIAVQLLVGFVLGIVVAAIASSKGRNAVGWFFVGFFAGLIGLIIVLCMSNLKEERAKWNRAVTERRRLREQLRQEQLKGEAFRQYSMARLDSHDNELGVDTRQARGQLSGPGGEDPLAALVNAQDSPKQDPSAEAFSSMDRRRAPNQPPAEEPVELANTTWYYERNGKQQGPVAGSLIWRMLRTSQLSRENLVWTEGMADWQPAGTVAPFRGTTNA